MSMVIYHPLCYNCTCTKTWYYCKTKHYYNCTVNMLKARITVVNLVNYTCRFKNKTMKIKNQMFRNAYINICIQIPWYYSEKWAKPMIL